MRSWFLATIWLLAWLGAGTADEADFTEQQDGSVLESVLADRQDPHSVALRWRVRGAAWDAERLQFYQRTSWQWGAGREFHLVTERDPGEQRWADFAAFYAHWGVPHDPLEVVVGDLRPGWATGLVCGRTVSRGSLPLSYPGRDSERLGYRGSGENQALRGLAIRLRRWQLTATAIGGWARRDARVDQEGTATSLPESGYHVTATERAGRNLLLLRAGGGRLQWQQANWRVGTSLLAVGFDRQVDLRRPERKPWAFAGSSQVVWGLDGEFARRAFTARGELARARQGHWAMVAAARARRGKTRLQVLARWYDPGFQSFFGGSVSRTGMENERGIFAALERRGWQIFADRQWRPLRTYYYPLPATISAWGNSLEYRLPKRWKAQWLVREDRAPRWQQARSVEEVSRRVRLDLDRFPDKGLLARVRLRVEGRVLERAPGKDERGGGAGALWKGRWKTGYAILHYTRFSTDSYYTRLYDYEYDLPGVVSIRPLYGDGWRGAAALGARWAGLGISVQYRRQRDSRTRHYGGVQVDLQRKP